MRCRCRLDSTVITDSWSDTERHSKDNKTGTTLCQFGSIGTSVRLTVEMFAGKQISGVIKI